MKRLEELGVPGLGIQYVDSEQNMKRRQKIMALLEGTMED
jgi:hypothetical protein